jgi:hypothetical protein
MFRALLAHPQEALHMRYFVYCVHVMSVAGDRITVPQFFGPQLITGNRNHAYLTNESLKSHKSRLWTKLNVV